MATRTELGSQKLFGFVLPMGFDGELIKQSILSVLTAIFLLTVFVFFVLPRFANLVAVAKRVTDLEKQVNNLTKSLTALDNFRDDVSTNARESVYLAIPTRFDPGYILLSLRQLALENKVGVVSYALGGGDVTKGVAEKGLLIPHQVKLEIFGSPINLINFVDNLDRYLPVTSVSELALSEVSKIFVGGTSESRLSLNLTYYHKPLVAIGPGFLLTNYLTSDELMTVYELTAFKRLGTVTPSGGVPTIFGKENLFGI